MVRPLQMIGGHLRQPSRRGAFAEQRRARPGDDIARLDEFGITLATLRHQLARHRAELVDVELVVGEEDKILEMLRAGRRVMRQPVQGIVDALGGEGRQRARVAQRHLEGAVGDLIVGAVEVRHVEQVTDRPADALGGGTVDIGSFQEGEMQRDRRLRFRNDHRHAVIAHDQPELFGQVAFEQMRLGDGGRELPRRRQMAVGLARVDLGERVGDDADLRIEGAVALVVAAAGGKCREGVAQEFGVALVEHLERGDGLAGIVEGLPGIGLRHDQGLDGLWIDSLFHDPL